ncbi:MAG: DNA-3-methyladenine glycosylase I [Dehalococcoidia bacterium]|nr:DNA-3-methyladenine glycosylase I [Dehalococcoidia bacterium]
MTTDSTFRCFGGPDDPLMMRYHDEEWGVPVHDDRRLFELLVLEGAQAGLSWRTVLHRRDGYRKAFSDFDIAAIARYGASDRQRLLADQGIIRNRLKVDTAITNAQQALAVQREFGSLDRYLWQFTGYKALRKRGPGAMADLPAETEESRAMSKDLRRRGFRFVGPTICYAFMQAVGMVNDHLEACFLAPHR